MPIFNSLRRPLVSTTMKLMPSVNSANHRLVSRQFLRSLSSQTAENTATKSVDSNMPTGELFRSGKDVGTDIVGHTASVQRTFGPNSNSNVMLECGGPNLAKHASFDPEYSRAQNYLRTHAIGPAVLSPVLLQGLVGTLVEAAFPQAVPVTQSMKTLQPLIVGVDVQAKITVTNVQLKTDDSLGYLQGKGYDVQLGTEVARTRDGVVIATGKQSIWIPDYRRM